MTLLKKQYVLLLLSCGAFSCAMDNNKDLHEEVIKGVERKIYKLLGELQASDKQGKIERVQAPQKEIKKDLDEVVIVGEHGKCHRIEQKRFGRGSSGNSIEENLEKKDVQEFHKQQLCPRQVSGNVMNEERLIYLVKSTTKSLEELEKTAEKLREALYEERQRKAQSKL